MRVIDTMPFDLISELLLLLLTKSLLLAASFVAVVDISR